MELFIGGFLCGICFIALLALIGMNLPKPEPIADKQEPNDVLAALGTTKEDLAYVAGVAAVAKTLDPDGWSSKLANRWRFQPLEVLLGNGEIILTYAREGGAISDALPPGHGLDEMTPKFRFILGVANALKFMDRQTWDEYAQALRLSPIPQAVIDSLNMRVKDQRYALEDVITPNAPKGWMRRYF